MPYCTLEDMVELYGEDLILKVADHDRDDIADPDIVEKGIKGADEIIDAYLSAQYTVPMAPIPGVVRTCSIDIALYKMALGRANRTDEMRVRYEDALKLLEKISTGKIGLGLPPVDPDGDGPLGPVDPGAKRKARSFDTGRA
jgi:phage gp36-like protein